MDAITTNKSCVAQSEPAVVFVSESGVWAGSISPPIKQKQQLSIKKRIKKVEVKNLLVMRAFNKNSWKNPVCKLLQKKRKETELLSTSQKDLKWTKDAADVSHRPIMFYIYIRTITKCNPCITHSVATILTLISFFGDNV